MKKGSIIIIFLWAIGTTFAQESTNKKIDTVKTEVVEVVSKYNPKIADANKIRKNPTLNLAKQSKKKKLQYTIFSAPVASTFIPKSGVVKGVDVGIKERLYNNYLALGYGNYNSPYAELYLHSNERFRDEFGLHAKYTSSLENIENTLLNSTFSNFLAETFYKKEERYFDWKINLETAIDQYNWYGLTNPNFITSTLAAIDEAQQYQFFKLSGNLDFVDAYIDNSTLSLAHFSDNYKSKEFLADLHTNFLFPLNFINQNLNDLSVKTNIEYLSGSFERDYANANRVNYSIFTANANPSLQTMLGDFSLAIGGKFFASFDTENKKNNFLVYPDIRIQKPLFNKKVSLYTGVTGGLHTNTFRSFTNVNPFVSPTLFITQTSTTYDAFLGFNGTIQNNLSFNIAASIKEEEDKPLFVKNNSKSDGVNTFLAGNTLLGYEYGNSFDVIYDDIKTASILAEIEYTLTKKTTLKANIEYQNFTTTNETEAWNLPTLQGGFKANYTANSWFTTANVFYVGERKDVLFNTIFPNNSSSMQTLEAFVDINLNGGYHFNDQFSAFLKVNNILNNSYERFANFNVQGFQILGGFTYKFDF